VSAGPFETSITVGVAEPALGPLRSVLRDALEASVAALRDPRGAPGVRVASRPGETPEQYAARAVQRTSYLVEQFGEDGEPARLVAAPRAALIAAIDAALQGPHASQALRALIELRRTVMEAAEDGP
jgi:ethanolamine utilization microcompartment shell protein EutL